METKFEKAVHCSRGRPSTNENSDSISLPSLQMHCTENSKQIFPEMQPRGLVPNLYSHVSVSDLYIPMIGLQTQYSKIGGPIEGTYKSVTDT
jgi:hypothetical protein